MTKIMMEARLGDLTPAYQVYRDTIEDIPESATVAVAWRPEMVADQLKAVQGKISPDTTPEQFTGLIEGTRSNTVSARAHALLEQGFAGTITSLFDKIVALEGIGDEAALDDLTPAIVLHQRLPAERRLGASVKGENGYYWGGLFCKFEDKAG